MLNPTQAFLDWFDTLPLSHRQDIASFAFAVLPGYDTSLALQTEGLESRFKDHLTATSDGRMRTVGNILALRALVEFFFIRHRSTKDQWQQTEQFLAGAKAFFEERGHEAALDTAEEGLTQLRFRSEQWLRTCEKWHALTSTALSDASLDAWWREQHSWPPNG